MLLFGPFRIDSQREQLLRGDAVLPVNRKAVQLLTILVERHGSVVSKEELYERVWPGRAATANNLSQHIFMLRSVLEDHGKEPAYLLTVPRVGYRFVGPLERSDAAPVDRVLAQQYCANAQASRVRYTREALASAVRLYERALAYDSRCVDALAGLAETHLLLADSGFSAPRTALEQVARHARAALDIDAQNVSAHVALAEVRMKLDYAWQEAESLLLDAFRAQPQEPAVHVALLRCYIAQRDWPRARQALENARSLAAEEDYPNLPLLRGLIHYYTGWFESAVAHFELVLDSHPDCAAAYLALAKAFIAQRQEAQARTALEAVLSIGPDPLGRSQPLPRREAMALQVLLNARNAGDYRSEWKSYPPSWYCEALIALHRGEMQTAQPLLRQSIAEREPLTLFAAADPLLRGLHPYIKYA